MRLISWNVNGIRAAKRKGFLEWFAKDAPDVLCIQETKARPEQLDDDLINVPDYHSFFSSHENKKGYSGVAVYTKEKPQKVLTGFGLDKKFDIEGRILILKFKKFTLFNIYFPNGKMSPERLQYKMDFYDAFLKYVNRLKKKGEKIVVCGDVNTAHKEIDLARPGPNKKISGFLPEERAWMDKLVGDGYIDTFRMFYPDKTDAYSWWAQMSFARERNVGWRIDYFFVSEDLKKKIEDAFILPEVMGSDHCPVGIEFKSDK